MADLDDFFAKKDKSKKKNKSKFTAGDLLSQQGDEPKKTKKKKAKEQAQQSQGGTGEGKSEKQEDEEWVDFEDQTEKDYSGLRIQNLQISKEDTDKQEEVEEPEFDEDGEVVEKKDTTTGPWNVLSSTQSTEPEPELEKKEEEPKPAPAPATPGKYIPPSLRGLQSPSSSAGPTPLRRKPKTAPNIQSELDFPTLGGGGAPVERDTGGGSYETVKTGGRQTEDMSGRGPKLELGNRYDALGQK